MWTIYNTLQILIGNSASGLLQNPREKIFHLCLIYVYITFSTNVLDMLVEINFDNEFFMKLDTLEDVEKAGVIPCAGKKEEFAGLHSLSHKKLVNRIVKCDVINCGKNLYQYDTTYNACNTNHVYARTMADIF